MACLMRASNVIILDMTNYELIHEDLTTSAVGLLTVQRSCVAYFSWCSCIALLSYSTTAHQHKETALAFHNIRILMVDILWFRGKWRMGGSLAVKSPYQTSQSSGKVYADATLVVSRIAKYRGIMCHRYYSSLHQILFIARYTEGQVHWGQCLLQSDCGKTVGLIPILWSASTELHCIWRV